MLILQLKQRQDTEHLLQLIIYVKKVKVAQSCPTLCNPMDYTILGILQARIMEWAAFSFSRGSSQPRSPALQADSLPSEPPGKPPQHYAGAAAKSLQLCSPVWLCATLWTAAHQAPLFLGFSRQEYWSGLPFPSPPQYYKTMEYFVLPFQPALQTHITTRILQMVYRGN